MKLLKVIEKHAQVNKDLCCGLCGCKFLVGDRVEVFSNAGYKNTVYHFYKDSVWEYYSVGTERNDHPHLDREFDLYLCKKCFDESKEA
jgi:hypothetical protein